MGATRNQEQEQDRVAGTPAGAGAAVLHIGDAAETMGRIPEGSVDLVLTSPPFLGLRSYLPDGDPDKGNEIGGESSPAAFVDRLLDVVEACGRVLAPHGSIAFELADSSAGSGGSGGDYNDGGSREGQNRFGGTARAARGHGGWPLPKSLCMIPELFRVALVYGFNPLNPARTTDPWIVRNVVRWVRTNPPPGRQGDKFRRGTSDMVIACKSSTRWFDAAAVAKTGDDGEMVAPLDWWEVSSRNSMGSIDHHAMWPEELLNVPVLSMCPPKVCVGCGAPAAFGVVVCGCGAGGWRAGVVLDPFAGSGTTLAVASGHGRHSIGIDLDARNAAHAAARCGMFLEVAG